MLGVFAATLFVFFTASTRTWFISADFGRSQLGLARTRRWTITPIGGNDLDDDWKLIQYLADL